MLKKITLIFILLFNTSIIAQNLSISGKIFDEDNEPLRNAVVQLFYEDRFLSFKKTDENGFFEFKNLQQGNYKIEINVLKYEKLTEEFLLENNKKLEYLLFSEQINLDEVVIKSQSFGTIKEDTITYNLENLRNGTEQTLGDLIAKLPGLQVDENGMVFYKGQKLDNILIDGNEFYGNKHQLATKNILDEMVEGVELISNYQPNDLLKSFGKGGKKVLNISLKENYKNSFLGNLLTGRGNSESFNNRFNLFNFNKEGNISLINHYNNIGESTMTIEDYFELNNQMEKSTNQVTKINDNEIPSFLKDERNFYTRENYFGSFNYTSKINQKGLLKSYTFYDLNSTKKIQDTYKNYGFMEQNEKQEITEKPRILQNVTKLDYKFSEKNFLTSETSFVFTESASNLDNIPILNYQEKTERLNLRQDLKWFTSIKNKWLGELELEYLNFNQNYKGDFLNNTDREVYEVQRNHYLAGYSLKSKKSEFEYQFRVQNAYQNATLFSSIFQDNAGDKETLNSYNLLTGIVLAYKKNNILINTSLDAKSYKSNFDIHNNQLILLPQASFSINNNGETFTFSYSLKDGLPSLEQLSSLKRRIDYQTIVDNSLISQIYIKKTHSLSLNYLNINLKKGQNVFANINYSISSNDIAENIYFQDNNFYKQFYVANQSKSLMIFTNYDKTFKKLPLAFKTNIIYNYNETNQQNQSIPNTLYANNLSFRLNLTTRFKSFPIQFQYVNNTNYMLNNHSLIKPLKILSLKNEIGGIYRNKKLYSKMSLQHNSQTISQLNTSNWNFNIEFTYSFKYFEVFISGFNIMNLDRNNILKNISNEIYQGYTEQQTLPGYIMTGFKFNLGN